MSMAERTHVWELLAHYKDGKPTATFWWDGRYVRCDDEDLLQQLKDGIMFGNRFEHSTEWLDEGLPRIFKNGYLTVRRAKKN